MTQSKPKFSAALCASTPRLWLSLAAIPSTPPLLSALQCTSNTIPIITRNGAKRRRPAGGLSASFGFFPKETQTPAFSTSRAPVAFTTHPIASKRSLFLGTHTSSSFLAQFRTGLQRSWARKRKTNFEARRVLKNGYISPLRLPFSGTPFDRNLHFQMPLETLNTDIISFVPFYDR